MYTFHTLLVGLTNFAGEPVYATPDEPLGDAVERMQDGDYGLLLIAGCGRR